MHFCNGEEMMSPQGQLKWEQNRLGRLLGDPALSVLHPTLKTPPRSADDHFWQLHSHIALKCWASYPWQVLSKRRSVQPGGLLLIHALAVATYTTD